jgi:hypothetical protein
MTEVERAYVGALIDGEGCVGIYLYKKAYSYPRVNVVNNEPELISALLRATGVGRISARLRIYDGVPYGNWTYVWSVQRLNDIESLVRQVSPYSYKLQKIDGCFELSRYLPHSKAKLSEDQVRWCRALYAKRRATTQEMADVCGVENRTVMRVVTGVTWKLLD